MTSLQDLELQILQQDPSLSPDRSAGNPAPVGLPERYSSFIGRADELAQVQDGLMTHRLVSLIGPGGIGKSSLAVEAARRWIATSDNDVAHITIGPLDEGEITGALATAIGLAPAPGVDPCAVITGYVAQRPHLILLDGCEPHLNEAAMLAHRLLTSAPGCRVLVTSREALGLDGEHAIRVPGLPIDDAVALFIDRSGLQTPLSRDMREAAEKVCTAVDGMALAIELAAARTRRYPSSAWRNASTN